MEEMLQSLLKYMNDQNISVNSNIISVYNHWTEISKYIPSEYQAHIIMLFIKKYFNQKIKEKHYV